MSESKRIIIIGPAYPLRGGGMSSFNERLARAIQDAGHQAEIYTFSLQYPSFMFPGTTQYATGPAPQGLNIRVLINSVNPFNWIRVGLRLKKEKPDIIIVRFWLPFMGPCFGTILRIARQNHFSKIICIADNVIPHEKRFGDKPFTKYFMPVADAFITMSRQVLQDLRTFTNKKALLVPHPLYDHFGEPIPSGIARKKLRIDEGDFVILFFGFIRKYKGLDLLIAAMPEVLKRIPNAKLLIAGEFYGDPEPYLEQIKQLHLEDHTLLHTEFIADNEIRNYLCAADVVVQPYIHATQSGVTPLAYHFELPMIVTNVGGLPDMVPQGKVGLVCEPNSSSIAKAIIDYHQKGKAFFIPGLLDEKKKYSWDHMVDAVLEAARP